MESKPTFRQVWIEDIIKKNPTWSIQTAQVAASFTLGAVRIMVVSTIVGIAIGYNINKK